MVLAALAGLFIRGMLKQDFGAWKIVKHHEKRIVELELEIKTLRDELDECKDELVMVVLRRPTPLNLSPPKLPPGPGGT